MAQRLSSVDAIVPFSESVDQTRVPTPNNFIIESHKPTLFDTPFHHHTSVELNFLQNCHLDYSFSGQVAKLKANRLVVFWGAAPHKVTDVYGEGRITNIYLSLGQFVRWGLPSDLVKAILTGEVIASRNDDPLDALLINRIYNEKHLEQTPWRRTHLAEIETRLRRLVFDVEQLIHQGDAFGWGVAWVWQRHDMLFPDLLVEPGTVPVGAPRGSAEGNVRRLLALRALVRCGVCLFSAYVHHEDKIA